MLNNIVWVLSYIGVFLMGMLGMVVFVTIAMKRSEKKSLPPRPLTRYNQDNLDPPDGMFDIHQGTE